MQCPICINVFVVCSNVSSTPWEKIRVNPVVTECLWNFEPLLKMKLSQKEAIFQWPAPRLLWGNACSYRPGVLWCAVMSARFERHAWGQILYATKSMCQMIKTLLGKLNYRTPQWFPRISTLQPVQRQIIFRQPTKTSNFQGSWQDRP